MTDRELRLLKRIRVKELESSSHDRTIEELSATHETNKNMSDADGNSAMMLQFMKIIQEDRSDQQKRFDDIMDRTTRSESSPLSSMSSTEGGRTVDNCPPQFRKLEHGEDIEAYFILSTPKRL